MTKHTVSILGICIQFIQNDELKIRTLCMKEITRRHTSDRICEILTEVLGNYGIENKQVFSLTSDNAPNMICAGRLMDELNQHELSEDEMRQMHEDEEFYSELIKQAAEKYATKNIRIRMTKHIGCAVHHNHLIIKHALAESPISEAVIKKCKERIKKLRTPFYLAMIKEAGQTLPVLEFKIRFNTVYLMVFFNIFI